MTKVKICGIQDHRIAECACSAGADYLGFVFAPSRRQVDPKIARSIIANLPTDIQMVGVFVDCPSSEMIDIAKFCGLDQLQIHGDLLKGNYGQLPLPVIKSVSIKDNINLGSFIAPEVDFLLFDTWHAQMEGGSGISFNWDLLSKFDRSLPYFLAGGLNSENVSEAVRKLSPYAVDVSSGVETQGAKDEEKIKQFIKNVKEINHELYYAK